VGRDLDRGRPHWSGHRQLSLDAPRGVDRGAAGNALLRGEERPTVSEQATWRSSRIVPDPGRPLSRRRRRRGRQRQARAAAAHAMLELIQDQEKLLGAASGTGPADLGQGKADRRRSHRQRQASPPRQGRRSQEPTPQRRSGNHETPSGLNWSTLTVLPGSPVARQSIGGGRAPGNRGCDERAPAKRVRRLGCRIVSSADNQPGAASSAVDRSRTGPWPAAP